MMRLVQVPTVYYRDTLDDMFGTPWYSNHTPRSVPCSRRVCSPRMAYPTLATLIAAMEAMDTSSVDENSEKTCSCSCQKEKTKASSNEKDQLSSEAEQTSHDTSSPSSDGQDNQSSEAETTTEVNIPLIRPSDIDPERFHVSLNLSSFNPENIEVKRVDNELKVSAKQEVERCGMVFHRKIQRSYNLPDDIDSDSLKSTLSTAGVLTVEAQRIVKDQNTDKDQSEEHKEEATDIDGCPSERPATEDSQEYPAEEGVTGDKQDSPPSDGMEVENTEKASKQDLHEKTDGQ